MRGCKNSKPEKLSLLLFLWQRMNPDFFAHPNSYVDLSSRSSGIKWFC